MIVVDTNILAYFWLPSEHTETAEAVMRRDPEWWAPFLWRSEFLNVLAGHLRRDLISPAGARRIALQAARLMAGRERAVAMQAVLALIARSSCTAYDCEFVALALDLGVPLITQDRRILEQFPTVARDLATFLG